MEQYDPLDAPDPAAWLALDETTRMQLVEAWHEAAGIELPNARVHAILHAVVESQVAAGDAIPVGLKLRQLMAQGMDRHQAIHAIGSVLIRHMFDLAQGGVIAAGDSDSKRRYFSALKRLNARKWLRSA